VVFPRRWGRAQADRLSDIDGEGDSSHGLDGTIAPAEIVHRETGRRRRVRSGRIRKRVLGAC
jgi:hypothetical protein